MGTLAVQARSAGIDTLLVTSDLDLLQVINGNVHVYALKKGLSNIELFHPESFEEKYGIKVDQFLDLKAIKGDSSDNIPGVPGIGEKGAVELLTQFKSLDGIYDNLDLIKDSLRKKLEDGKDLAYLSKQLAAIWTDAPVQLELDKLDVGACDPARVRDVLQRLEFRTLVRQLPEVMQVQEEHMHHISSDLVLPKQEIIDDNSKLDRLDLSVIDECIVWTYSTGKHGKDPLYLSISPSNDLTYTFDLEKLDGVKVTSILAEVFEREAVTKVGYDIKSCIKVGYELGCKLIGVGHDVLIGAFLINSLRREQSLSELASADLGYEGSPFENLAPDEVLPRVPEIIAVIRGLYGQQVEQLESLPKIHELAQTIEWPVIPVLAAMEYEGIKLNTSYLKKMSDELGDQISDIEQQIYGYAGIKFNSFIFHSRQNWNNWPFDGLG
jgi:DNA polymerase-1